MNALLTISQVADAMSVQARTVRRWIDRGDLAAVRLGPRPGSPIRVAQQALEHFIEGAAPTQETDELNSTTSERRGTQLRSALRAMDAINDEIQALPDDTPQDQIDALTAELDDAVAEVERCKRNKDDADRLTRSVADSDVEIDQRSTTNTRASVGGDITRRLGNWMATQTRGLLGGSGSGSYIVPEMFMQGVWDRLAAESVGLRSGFRNLTIGENEGDRMHIPVLSSDAASAWTSESTAITPTDPTVNELIAIPRKLAALVQVSNELLRDSSPSALEVLWANVIRSLALKLDLGFYEGTGSAPEIRGLKNVVGIQTVSMGTNGAAFTNLDPFADAIGLLAQANAEAGAIVMHPRSWQALSKVKEIAGSTKPVLQESAGAGTQGISRSVYGVPVYLSSQLSTTETQGTSGAVCSSAYVYQPDQVLAVGRYKFEVEVDRSRLFNSDQAEVRAITRWDVAVPNPTAVVRILGIL